MSSGYASRLKEFPNKGVCGLPELKETPRCFQSKRKQLANMVKKASTTGRVVILTGAGISTASGIPDFRGPNGIWTQEKKNNQSKENANKKKKTNSKRKRQDDDDDDEAEDDNSNVVDSTNPPPPPPPPPSSSSSPSVPSNERPLMDFSQALPTLTHKAILFLVEQKVVHFCITQNVDGLHQRSGLSRYKLAVLHGCVFTERCEDCGTEHFGDSDVGGMSFQRTGRKCQAKNNIGAYCQGYLRDTLLDWKDPLPVDDLELCEKECDEADLVLCLGTSLRIEPAASLPARAKKFVIVNLQCTPYDNQASLIIRAKVDVVMENLLCDLGFPNWQGGAEWTPRPIERLWRNPASGEYASTWWKKGAQSDSDSEDQDESK